MAPFPIFNYPTTVLWVDDDNLFLKAISHTLGKQYKISTFNDAKKAVEFFNDYTPLLQSIPFLQGCRNHEDYDTAEHLPVDLNATAFSRIQDILERKNEISVLVVDYNMPGMTGIELCRQLKDLPMKKILITGEVENAQAVSAFNEGIIDRFIRKDSPTLVSELHSYFDILMKQYFKDNTHFLLSHLETDRLLPISDPIFVSFFKSWCEENKVKEYFLTDKQGNFCVIDESGEASYFVVHSDDTLNSFVDIYNDNEDFSTLISAVLSRDKIPFFGVGKDGWQVDSVEWNSHFYAPNILDGRERYYWTAIK